MIGRITEALERNSFWGGVGLIVGGISLLKIEFPRFAVALILAGCLIFTRLIWNATSKHRLTVRVATLVAAISISILVIWLVGRLSRTEDLATQPIATRRNVPESDLSQDKHIPETNASQDKKVEDHKSGVSNAGGVSSGLAFAEVTVIMYNGAADPEFSVDGRPKVPMNYSSGIARFQLPAGTHLIRAEYSNRVCSATVSIPVHEARPISANCSLKQGGGA